MEAFRSLINGHLPPAGEPVVLSYKKGPPFLEEIGSFTARFVDSGTSALACALANIKNAKPFIDQPEVIVPGYCCPDLIAAAVFSGFTPVVVDISPNDSGYDIPALERAITPDTRAVIAVNFLGISEKFSQLTDVLTAHPQVALVADNAQWFPDSNEVVDLEGDYVVFSFGRGKPVSLLGGGMLLTKRGVSCEESNAEAPLDSNNVVTGLKFRAYNWLLKPQFYQLLSRNPFIRLGETRYHPLERIQTIDNYRLSLLAANIESYRGKPRSAEKFYDQHLKDTNQLSALYSARRRRLLRYPVLLPSQSERDKLLVQLTDEGLGATAMYQLPLAELSGLSGLSGMLKGNKTPNAARFAERLLTLPLHSGVKTRHLDRIARIFEKGAPPG